MRIVVTGGAGFIGSHIVATLIARQDAVTVIDDLSRGSQQYIPARAQLEVLDMTSSAAAEVIAAVRPEAVLHLAAQVDVATSIAEPLADARTNVLGTLNMLQAAQKSGTRLFVTMSSGGALYGNAANIPTGEKEPIAPLSPYGASKASAEVYATMMCRNTPMRCVSLRLSNVYGPRQSTKGEAGVVGIFAKKMLRGQPPTIFGDGQQTRDFIYVSDVCHAVSRCLTHRTIQGAYNISSGRQTSILTLLATLRQPTGYEGPIKYAPGLPGEVTHSCLNFSLAQDHLQWRPQMTLADGLLQTVADMRRAGRLSASTPGCPSHAPSPSTPA